jgi:hypothetical protein
MAVKTAPQVTGVVKVGTILSETSFYVVEDLRNDKIIVRDDLGNKITMGEPYVNQICVSADSFETEEKKSMTELAEIFINSPRIAMTVAFYKKDVEKTKTTYNKEVADAISQVQNAKVSEVEGLLKKLIETPISRVIPGELRVMKGRHHGHIDELGRVHFIDMELPKQLKVSQDGSTYDTRKREVDPRTIQWLIVNKVKYILK